LTVRKGKFGKSRALPLQESTVEALVRYLHHPLRRMGTDVAAPLFVSCRRRRLSYPALCESLYKACVAAEISKPLPRPHDFRHTFAIGRVEAWYAQERDVNALLPTLSTYLGHVSVENTRLYLIANGTLLEQAAARFARYTGALDEVRL
jgi:integrase/recombinase XerD